MSEPKKYVLVCKKPNKWLVWLIGIFCAPLLVVASLVVIDMFQSDVHIDVAADVSTNMPASLTGIGGSNYTYAYNLTNYANTIQAYNLSLSMSPVDNSFKLVLDETAGVGGVAWKVLNLSANSTASGVLKFQFNTSASGNYKLNLSVTPYNFGWVI